MKKKLFYLELFCAIGTIILGILFHFAFSWFNNWKPLALFFAVNESVWEHCKIAFWPAFILAIIECLFIFKKSSNFIIAKSVLLLLIPSIIIILFYMYTSIIGRNIMFLDISIFFAAIILAQYCSYKLLIHKQLNNIYNNLSILLIIILIMGFSTFTFYPPHINLFKDSKTRSYGIPNQK